MECDLDDFRVIAGLEWIEIQLGLKYNFDAMPQERSRKFLSVVTKCLLFDRVPGLNLRLRIWRDMDVNDTIFDMND